MIYKKRYEARTIGTSGAYAVYDNQRGVHLVKSMTPNASYNKAVVEEITEKLNKPLPDYERGVLEEFYMEMCKVFNDHHPRDVKEKVSEYLTRKNRQ